MGLRNDIQSKITATTAGQSWSTSSQADTLLRNGQEFVVHGAPNSFRRKILIFGSSVAYGSGGTYANGWANRLKSLLEPRGWTFLNHSIGGNTTVELINRFYTDVVPHEPDYLIIALSLNNEGIMGVDPESVYQQFVTNVHKLVAMSRQHGIVPIIAGPYPNNGYNATHYRYLRQLQQELDSWPVASFNFFGAGDDLTGKWLAGAFADATHPNDTGHEEMFRTIPPSIFDRLVNWNDTIKRNEAGGVLLGNDTTTERPLEFVPSDPVRSFTIAFSVRNVDGGGSKSLCGIGPSGARIRNPNYIYEYAGNAGTPVTSTVNSAADRKWHHLALTHNTIEGKSWFYVDGVPIGSTADSFASISTFSVGGRADAANAGFNATGFEFKDVALYRSRLNDDQVKALANGKILKASLELYAPLSDKTLAQGSRLLNLAPTSAYLKANSSLLTPLTTPDVMAREIDLPSGKLYSTNGTNLVFRKNDGTETVIVA